MAAMEAAAAESATTLLGELFSTGGAVGSAGTLSLPHWQLAPHVQLPSHRQPPFPVVFASSLEQQLPLDLSLEQQLAVVLFFEQQPEFVLPVEQQLGTVSVLWEQVATLSQPQVKAGRPCNGIATAASQTNVRAAMC